MVLKPLRRFYNLENLSHIALSMDVDWAPDFVLQEILPWFLSHGLPLTIFATHPSQYLKKFAAENYAGIELGIHPNFSQKFDVDKIDFLLAYYGQVSGSRSHRNIAGRNVSDLLRAHNISYDSSYILWRTPFTQVSETYNGILNIPYVWEDGYHLETSTPLEDQFLPLDTPGLKVLNFHPVLLYLNCTDDDQRKKAVRGIKDLTMVTKEYLDPFVNKNYGIWSFAKSFLLNLAENKDIHFYLLNDVVKELKNARI